MSADSLSACVKNVDSKGYRGNEKCPNLLEAKLGHFFDPNLDWPLVRPRSGWADFYLAHNQAGGLPRYLEKVKAGLNRCGKLEASVIVAYLTGQKQGVLSRYVH